jgi:hypothetical protein
MLFGQPAVIVETPIPKAKRGGIGKLNNPAKRNLLPKLALEFHTRDYFAVFP